MLTSITPLGQRGRGGSWRRAVTAYALSSVAGGGAVGALLGALGAPLAARLSRDVVLAVAAVAAVAAAVADGSRRVPSLRRQVDERWLRVYRDWVWGAGFGVQLGAGAVTIVTTAAVYLTWVLELLAGSWRAGLVIGLAFGAVRALPVLGQGGVVTAEALRAGQRRWHAALPLAHRSTVAVELAAVAALAAAAVGAAS